MQPAPQPLVRAVPEVHGIRSSALLDFVDDLERQGLDPHAVMVARHGEVAFEAAWRPYDSMRPALVYSASKTFTAIAIGFLEAEGRLSLTDSVGDLLGLPNPNGITVRHLLSMNSGHDGPQIEALQFDVRALLTVPPAAQPGTSFAYNSDATYALSCIVTAVTGERLTDYLRPRLLDPIGIGDRWMKSTRGIEQGFSGYHITVEDLARVAIALADGGRWRGMPVIPAGYVAEMSQAWSDNRDHSQPDDPSNEWWQGYGYQVWRNTRGFRLDGAYGQFGIVIPDRGLVIAYQGATETTEATLQTFWRLVDAIDDEPVAVDEAATEALAARVAALDGWDARDRTRASAEPAGTLDTTGWMLTDSEEGWTLTLPSGHAIEIGAGDWARGVLDLPAPADAADAVVDSPPVERGDQVVVAARGENTDDGVRAHIVVPTSPHRLLVQRAADGALTAAWHTVPLQGTDFAALAVPARVAAES